MGRSLRKAVFGIPLFFSVVAAMGAAPALAEVRIEPYDVSGTAHKIVISGPISELTLMEFSQAMADARIAGVSLVELNSPGGSVYAAIAIGTFLRRGGFDTGVLRGGRCDSACVLILAAGVRRTAAPGRVGIHRPYFQAAASRSVPAPAEARQHYDRLTDDIESYLGLMGVEVRLVYAMLDVPSDRIRRLTSSEVAAYRLENGDRQAPSVTAPVETRERVVTTREQAELAPDVRSMAQAMCRDAGRSSVKRDRVRMAKQPGPTRPAKERVALHGGEPPWSTPLRPLHRVVRRASEPPWSAKVAFRSST